MVGARVLAEGVEGGEVFGLGELRGRPPIAGDPAKRVLDDVNVMQSRADRLVVSRLVVCSDETPVFGVRPRLMTIKIAKDTFHIHGVAYPIPRNTFAVVMICAECRCACSAA